MGDGMCSKPTWIRMRIRNEGWREGDADVETQLMACYKGTISGSRIDSMHHHNLSEAMMILHELLQPGLSNTKLVILNGKVMP